MSINTNSTREMVERLNSNIGAPVEVAANADGLIIDVAGNLSRRGNSYYVKGAGNSREAISFTAENVEVIARGPHGADVIELAL